MAKVWICRVVRLRAKFVKFSEQSLFWSPCVILMENLRHRTELQFERRAFLVAIFVRQTLEQMIHNHVYILFIKYWRKTGKRTKKRTLYGFLWRPGEAAADCLWTGCFIKCNSSWASFSSFLNWWLGNYVSAYYCHRLLRSVDQEARTFYF